MRVPAFIALWALGLCAMLSSIGDAAPAPPHPVMVNVAVQIRNLANVDELKEQWQVTGTLFSTWKAGKTNWRPSLGFRNEVSPAAFRDVESYVTPDGKTLLLQDFNATLSTDLDLRRFPFDSEVLPLVVEPIGFDADHTILTVNRSLSSIPHDRFAELSQWRLVSIGARPYKDTTAQHVVHGIVFDLRVRRNSASYLWKFMIPLFLLVIISWISFWLSHEIFTTKDQLATAISTLLIIVAFNFVSSNLLPRTNYITYIDAFLFVSFLFVILSIAFIVASHMLEDRFKSPENALLLRRIGGIALPVAFLISQGILILSFRL